MIPEARFERVLDSFAWVEYFRGTEPGRRVAEELEAAAVGTPLVVVAELRDKYVRERIPNWSRDLSFIKDMSAILPENEDRHPRGRDEKSNAIRGAAGLRSHRRDRLRD